MQNKITGFTSKTVIKEQYDLTMLGQKYQYFVERDLQGKVVSENLYYCKDRAFSYRSKDEFPDRYEFANKLVEKYHSPQGQ